MKKHLVALIVVTIILILIALIVLGIVFLLTHTMWLIPIISIPFLIYLYIKVHKQVCKVEKEIKKGERYDTTRKSN